jgi:hypothetical protein
MILLVRIFLLTLDLVQDVQDLILTLKSDIPMASQTNLVTSLPAILTPSLSILNRAMHLRPGLPLLLLRGW